MTPRSAMLTALLVAIVAGCARDPGPADPAHYDQHCAVDADCVLVFPRACPCTCDDCAPALGAVNRSDQTHFKQDEETARPCAKRAPWEQSCMVCDCPGDGRVAACQCGLCSAVLPDAGACMAPDSGI